MQLLWELSWKWLVVQGVLGILFGLAAVVFPIETLSAFVLLWGLWALLDGFVSLGEAFARGRSRGTRLLFALLGVVAVAAGAFAVLRPFDTVQALTWVLGVWLLVRGVGELVAAFGRHSGRVRALVLLGAVLDLALGLLFFLNPGGGATSLTVAFGVLALVWGVVALASGIVLRSQGEARPVPASSWPPPQGPDAGP